MDGHDELRQVTQRSPLRLPLWLGFCAFLAIALFFLWGEHRAHLLGALPYLLLLLCPVLHLFMHGGHARAHASDGGHPAHDRPGGNP